MKIIRIFYEGNLKINSVIELDKVHYIINVMKRKVNDNIVLINGKDGEFLGQIIEIKKKSIFIKIIEQTKTFQKEKFLGLIFPYISKIDLLVKNAVEFGATEFIPFKSDYCQYNYREDKVKSNILEAIEQCERTDFPNIQKENNLKNILSNLDNKNNVILFCEERSNGKLLDVIKNIDFTKNIYVIVGCEGGFSNSEKELIKSFKNVISISLGNRILRTENATSFILSIVNCFY